MNTEKERESSTLTLGYLLQFGSDLPLKSHFLILEFSVEGFIFKISAAPPDPVIFQLQ